MGKKTDFDLSKILDLFCICRKKWFLEIKKNLDMFLLHKIKYFGLKNIRSVFEELKKCFLITEKSDLFL